MKRRALAPPGSTNPLSINSGGEITGWSADPNGMTHGFVVKNSDQGGSRKD